MPHFKVYPDSEHFMSDSCPAAGSLGVQVPRPVGELSATFRRLQQVFETHRSSQILSSLWDHCPSLKGATVEASENDEKQRPGGRRGPGSISSLCRWCAGSRWCFTPWLEHPSHFWIMSEGKTVAFQGFSISISIIYII